MRKKAPLEDNVEIDELMARHAWSLDIGDFDGYADCFCADGWLSTGRRAAVTVVQD